MGQVVEKVLTKLLAFSSMCPLHTLVIIIIIMSFKVAPYGKA